MTNSHNDKAQPPAVSEAVVKPRRGISIVWLLPLVAAGIALWLIYRGVMQAGIEVTVGFDSAAGITPGKTPVIYQGITIGAVESTALNDDLRGVTVTLSIERAAAQLLRRDTRFWLVSPQISLAGVSGIETLVSGNYITLQPGGGPEQRQFTALSEPPPLDPYAPGLNLVLEADELGSISAGSPVLYQKVVVGQVEAHKLEAARVLINVRIKPQYSELVRTNSRFWNASGIRVHGDLQGFSLETNSLAAIIAGGIAFETPADQPGEAVESGQHFRLHPSRADAEMGLAVDILFNDPEGLVADQTPIRFRGLQVGTIGNVVFDTANPNGKVTATARLNKSIAPYINGNTRFWLEKPELSLSDFSGVGDLLSGAHVAVAIDGAMDQPVPPSFAALETAPAETVNARGLRLVLYTEQAGSVRIGSPVYYRRVPVGRVESIDINRDGVQIGVFIAYEHASLARADSRFWNASGVSLTGNLSGIELRTESVATLLSGGIAFTTPEHSTARAAKPGERFRLYPNFKSMSEIKGTEITLTFASGTGLSKGTEIKYQGIKVGEVSSVSLDQDMSGVVVNATLMPSAGNLAREGSQFWVVKPQLGLVATSNLETLVTGPYITVRPGDGPSVAQFRGLEAPPGIAVPSTGLNLVLTTKRRGSIKEGIRVYYRDVAVGQVTGYALAPNAKTVHVHVNIEPRYAPLVRWNSRFWNASGVSVKISPFSGASIQTNSMESLLQGGISFATPEGDERGKPASDGLLFLLHDEPEDEWLKWQPAIEIEG